MKEEKSNEGLEKKYEDSWDDEKGSIKNNQDINDKLNEDKVLKEKSKDSWDDDEDNNIKNNQGESDKLNENKVSQEKEDSWEDEDDYKKKRTEQKDDNSSDSWKEEYPKEYTKYINHKFTYDKIIRFYDINGKAIVPIDILRMNNYRCTINLYGYKPSDFIVVKGVPSLNIAPESKPTTEKELVCHNYGLKFHISLPEKNREMYGLGWNIVCGILIKNNVNAFKIYNPRKNFSEHSPSQRGKDITVYTFYNPEKSLDDWINICRLITEQLTSAKVPPGYRTLDTGDRRDKPLKGSNYISYRYEQEIYDEFKGWPETDYFENVVIQVENQLLIPEYVEEKDLIVIELKQNLDY